MHWPRPSEVVTSCSVTGVEAQANDGGVRVLRGRVEVRLLQQRYPEVHIKLFYRRDVERLRQKYGSPQAQKNPGNLLTS